jgi:cathepsin B
VTEECLPYSSGDGTMATCPFSKNFRRCQQGTFIKYKAQQFTHYNVISDAKLSILTNGSIEAGDMVYEDFFSYAGGVYRRTSDNFIGNHAIKIVGWGVDTDGSEYWICANSWSTAFGEDEFFRIAFGECGIDQRLYSGMPYLRFR